MKIQGANGETLYCYGRVVSLWHDRRNTYTHMFMGSPAFTDESLRAYLKHPDIVCYWHAGHWRVHPTGERYRGGDFPWARLLTPCF